MLIDTICAAAIGGTWVEAVMSSWADLAEERELWQRPLSESALEGVGVTSFGEIIPSHLFDYFSLAPMRNE